MAREQQDEQQRHFERMTEEEAASMALDDTGSALTDPADTRPGRPEVTDQPGEARPPGPVGQSDFAPDGT